MTGVSRQDIWRDGATPFKPFWMKRGKVSSQVRRRSGAIKDGKAEADRICKHDIPR